MASSQMSFDRAAADKWLNELEEVYNTTNDHLKEVSVLMQEIKSESEGPQVDTFFTAAESMLEGFGKLLSGFQSMKGLISQAIDQLAQMLGDFIGDAVGAFAHHLTGT